MSAFLPLVFFAAFVLWRWGCSRLAFRSRLGGRRSIDISHTVTDPGLVNKLVKEQGNVVTLWSGSTPTFLVVGSESIAKEAFGRSFASRPRGSEVAKSLTRGYSNINSSPYGPEWKELRRNLVNGVLRPSCLSQLEPIQEEAVDSLVNRLKGSYGIVSGLTNEVRKTLVFILAHICFGRSLDDEELKQVHDLMKETTELLTPSPPSVLGPPLPSITRYLGERLGFTKPKLDDFFERQDRLFGRLIAEARSRSKTTGDRICYVDTVEDDAAAAILCRELFIAGNDTTAGCVQWGLASLIQHSECQEKLFRELIGRTGGERRRILVEDVRHLPYLRAVVWETLRKHPPVYLSAPHTSVDAGSESELAGHRLPSNATIVVHLHSIANDAATWHDPEAFRPERFMVERTAVASRDLTAGMLSADPTVGKGTIMPFGAGPRMCPGRNLGLLHVYLILANLVRNFEWRRVGEEPLDMRPRLDFSITMQEPLRAEMRPRLL